MPFSWNLVQETDKKPGSCTCPIKARMGVEVGCLGGHLTHAWHTRIAFLNRKTQKMSRDETAVGSQEMNVKKNCRKRAEHTEEPGDKKEGKARAVRRASQGRESWDAGRGIEF